MVFMNGCRVLYYHVIANELPEIYPAGIKVQRFELQMLWLKKLGFGFLPLSQALSALEAPEKNCFCLSLDDGFASSYPALLEMAVKFNLRPTLFLIGKCLDNQALAWNHKLIILKNRIPQARLEGLISELLSGTELVNLFKNMPMNRKDEICDTLWTALMPMPEAEYLQQNKPFLSREQLDDLLSCGIELASHSYSHPNFSRLNLAEAKDEVLASFTAFTGKGLPYQKILAYPYGLACDASTEASLISQSGLKATLGTLYSHGDNIAPNTRWQRQCMEASPLANLLEFGLRPMVRVLKNKL